MPNPLFVNEERLLGQPQFTAQTHPAKEPNFNLVPERKVHPAGQVRHRNAPADNPFVVTCFRF